MTAPSRPDPVPQIGPQPGNDSPQRSIIKDVVGVVAVILIITLLVIGGYSLVQKWRSDARSETSNFYKPQLEQLREEKAELQRVTAERELQGHVAKENLPVTDLNVTWNEEGTTLFATWTFNNPDENQGDQTYSAPVMAPGKDRPFYSIEGFGANTQQCSTPTASEGLDPNPEINGG